MTSLLVEGDSIMATGLDTSGTLRTRYISAALPMFNGPYFTTLTNSAVGGSTISDVLGRIDAILNATTYTFIHLHIGTNDLGTANTPLADMLFQMYDLISRLKLHGATLIVDTILPRSGLSVAQEEKRRAFNQWLRNAARSRLGLIDVLVDLDKIDFDPSTETFDGLHPNSQASVRIMQVIASQVASLIPNTHPGASHSSNRFTNPNLLGVDGASPEASQITIPTAPAGTTIVPVKDVDDDLRQGFILGGTNSGTNVNSTVTLGPNMAVSAGETVFGAARVALKNVQGLTGAALSMRVASSPTTFYSSFAQGGYSDDRELIPENGEFDLRTLPLVVPAGASTALLRLIFYYRDGAAVSGQVNISELFFGPPL